MEHELVYGRLCSGCHPRLIKLLKDSNWAVDEANQKFSVKVGIGYILSSRLKALGTFFPWEKKNWSRQTAEQIRDVCVSRLAAELDESCDITGQVFYDGEISISVTVYLDTTNIPAENQEEHPVLRDTLDVYFHLELCPRAKEAMGGWTSLNKLTDLLIDSSSIDLVLSDVERYNKSVEETRFRSIEV